MRVETTLRFLDGPLAGFYLHVQAKDDNGSFELAGYEVYAAGPADDEAAEKDDDAEWSASYRLASWSHEVAQLAQAPNAQTAPQPTELLLRRPGVEWLNGLALSNGAGDE